MSCRSEPSASERTQRFISPPRSELKAIERPSGDQAPRLSSRVVATTASGSPVGSAEAGSRGSLQMSAFCCSTEKVSFDPSGASATWRSRPAPVVICCSGPAGSPAAVTSARQTLRLPPR